MPPDAMYDAPPPEAPDGGGFELSPDVQQAALDVDPFDADSIAAVFDAFRGDLETHVNSSIDEQLAQLGLTSDGEPIPQYPAHVQAAIDDVHDDNLLASTVSALAEQPGLEHLASVDADAVVEKARAIMPQVAAALGATDEAAVQALLIAADDVAREAQGDEIINREIALLAAAYDGGLDARTLVHAKAAAEEAFTNGATFHQAIRMGLEQATGVDLTVKGSKNITRYYGMRGKILRDHALTERRAAEQHKAKPQPVLSRQDRVAKYSKIAHDHKVAAGQRSQR